MNSPPGLKFGVVTPKSFRSRSRPLTLVPLFLRALFLSSFLSFSGHRLVPPFQSATAEGLGEDKFNFTTRLSNLHIFFVKQFSRVSANIFTSSCATFSLFARGIFFVRPSRKKTITSFSSLSIPEFAPLTSLATMMSQCLSRSLRRAFSAGCVRTPTPSSGSRLARL